MAYRRRHVYTDPALKTAQIKDLLVDIRCGYRDGLGTYAMLIELEVIALITGSSKMDRYGYYRVGA